jgi:hypothetical protein
LFPFDAVEPYALFEDEDYEEDDLMDFINEDLSVSSGSSEGREE